MPRTKVFMEPIGLVRNNVTGQEHLEGFRKAESEIVLKKQYVDGLRGLTEYSHVIVLFWLHRSKDEKPEVIVHPGNRSHLPRLGILATRNTRRRPNRIGMTVAKLLGVRSNVIRVKGLDAFNGSPVLDIKPYTTWDLPSGSRIEGSLRGSSLKFEFDGKFTVPEWWSRF
jgi:tRNA (adenine37-N6)-methyltransferase